MPGLALRSSSFSGHGLDFPLPLEELVVEVHDAVIPCAGRALRQVLLVARLMCSAMFLHSAMSFYVFSASLSVCMSASEPTQSEVSVSVERALSSVLI